MINYDFDNLPYFPDYETRRNPVNNAVYFLTKVRKYELQRWYAIPVLWTGVITTETTEEDIMKSFLHLAYSVIVAHKIGKFDHLDTDQRSEIERLVIK